MQLEGFLKLLNRFMILFDVVLASGAIFAPKKTLRLLGHRKPSQDATELFRRCGPIWIIFAAGHATADRRGSDRDWWGLAWLRATEIGTDALWARSGMFSRRGSKTMLRLAGVANLGMALGFAKLAGQSKKG